MTKPKRRKKSATSVFDGIVNDIVKSVVVAPKDPNGGAELPNQAAKPRQKAESTQVMAVFDRNADQSDEQLEDWEQDTDAATGSDLDYGSDNEDADEVQMEDNEDEIYDPLSDDDEIDEDELEAMDLPDEEEEYMKRDHKRRRVRKSAKAEEDDDEDEDDEDFPPEEDDDDDDEYGQDEEDHDDESEAMKRYEDKKKASKRRKEVRKALGADAMKYVDGNNFIKSLTDAVYDMKDEFISEVRALRSENLKLKKMVQRENREMAKALVTSQAQLSGYQMPAQENFAPAQEPQAIRKGYGAPVQRQPQKGQQGFNLAKSLDVLDEAFQNNVEGVTLRDTTILENDRSPQNLSRGAQEVLRKANLI